MYLAHIQRHTTQGRRGTSAGRRARRRCSVSAQKKGCRTARSLCCSAASTSTWRGHAHGCWPCPRHKNDVDRASRFGTSDALNSRRRKWAKCRVCPGFVPNSHGTYPQPLTKARPRPMRRVLDSSPGLRPRRNSSPEPPKQPFCEYCLKIVTI